MRVPVVALLLFATVLAFGATAAAEPPMAPVRLDAAAIDALWDYDQPAASERRFRTSLASVSSASTEALELLTQIARAQGLQRDFPAAHATLDGIEPALERHPPRIEVRYLLERGRVFNSSGDKARALPLFRAALDKALAAHEDFYAIDAAHMLAIVAAADEQLKWNLDALALTERTADLRARTWVGSLYNNIGWTYHDRGDYATALTYFEKALKGNELRGDPGRIRIARWSVARTYRSLGRFDEALAIQRSLAQENQTLGAPDGYVFEELAELALASGDAAGAKPWAAKAHAALANDPWLKANEAARLERLRRLAEGE